MAEPLNTSAASFDALYRDCARDVYAYVRTLLGDDASAEDVTALAFERAYRRRASFDERRGSRRGWLFAIARNAALDELRRRRRSAPLIGELSDGVAAAPEEQADLALRRSAVRIALDALPARERELVALKFHGGLTNAPPAAGALKQRDRAAEPALRVPRPGGPISPSTSPRKVERRVSLALSVPTGELESTADDVIGTVDRFDGIVASSSIGREDGSGGEASFDLRIPTDRLDDALAALSKLGHVAERRQDLVDISGAFTSTAERLSDARAERKGLQKALGSATSKAQVDSLRARLRTARRQVARLQGDRAALRRRADLATLSVTVRGDAEQDGDGSGAAGRWSPGDAAGDALRVLEVAAGATLIALAVAAPLALFGALIAIALRAGRRRRREGALDPA